jgi:Arc/MetJ-type ribon-helix-helix transcriptional regulator
LHVDSSYDRGMKVVVNLAEDDLRFLDRYAKQTGLNSRSAALRKAVQLLRDAELRRAYVDAWKESDSDGDAVLWEATAGDGIEGR